MIENEFFNEVKKRKVEYQQKLNDVTPPELEGIGGRIDIQFSKKKKIIKDLSQKNISKKNYAKI